MLVAGPQGAGKSEFVKQLLSLKRFIMTNPPERIVWFYGRHKPDLSCYLNCFEEISSIELYEGLPTNIEVMFDRSKRNICIIDDLMQSVSGNQLVENLFTNGRHLNLSVVFVSQSLFYAGKKFRTISLNSTYIVFQESQRSNPNPSSSVSNVPIQTKILTSSLRRRNKISLSVLFLDFHPNSPEFARVRGNIFPCDLLEYPYFLCPPKDTQI